MLKEKQTQLINKLTDIIKQFGYDNSIKQAVGNEFKGRNLDTRDASYTIMGNQDLRTLSDSEDDIRFLFLFTYALNKALPSESGIDIKVEDYFTNVEIDRWRNYKADTKPKNIFPIRIKMEQLRDRIWQGKIHGKVLNEWDVNNLIYYNLNTQRNPKITIAGERINVDMKEVNEIVEGIKKGKQFPTTIRINLRKTGEESYSYDAKNEILTIEEGVLDIFDGYHRKTANSIVYGEFPDFEFTWSLCITNLTEKECHDFMTEINKQKPIKKEILETKDYSKNENIIVDIISGNVGDLANAMKEDNRHIELNMALTKKSIIANAIRDNYQDINTSFQRKEIAEWIIEFTDYLMGVYADEFITNPYEVKKISYINDKNMFYGYIALSALLFNNKNWKTLLKKKMKSVDFSKENELWKQIGLHVGEANVATRKKLYAFMKEGVN